MLAIDLGLLRRRAAEVTTRAALAWTGVWTLIALGFSALLHHRFGAGPALDFLTAWALEKALSIDNLLVFVLLLAAFRVPKLHEHRLLTFGILGALVLRAVFVLAGAAIVGRFHAVTYIFGAVLLVSGIKLLTTREDASETPTEGRALALLRRFVPSTEGFRGGRFFVVEGGKSGAPISRPSSPTRSRATSSANRSAERRRTERRSSSSPTASPTIPRP